jgi:hypothetical protein
LTAPALSGRDFGCIPFGRVFEFGGRCLRVVSSHGIYPESPVIVEEMHEIGCALPGQLSLWSLDGVLNAGEYGRLGEGVAMTGRPIRVAPRPLRPPEPSAQGSLSARTGAPAPEARKTSP